MNRWILVTALVLIAASAAAQPRPAYEVDDFVDPRQHDGPVFISRLVLGGARGLVDDYRVAGGNTGFLQVTNTFYGGPWQVGFNHTETTGDTPRVFRCDCRPILYLPTPSPSPAPPPPGPKNAFVLAFYRPTAAGEAGPAAMLHTSLTFSRQRIDTPLRSLTTGEVIDHRSGHEHSVGIDTDTRLALGGHVLWGSVAYTRTWTSGTIDDRMQNELTYTARPTGWEVGRVLMRTTLTVGGVSNRGGTAINVVNPAFEAFWHSHLTKANVHVVWSPQALRDGANGWRTHSQIALLVDRALWVHMFR